MIPLALVLFPVAEILFGIAVIQNWGWANAIFAGVTATILGIGLLRTSGIRLTTSVMQAMAKGQPPGMAALQSALVGLAAILLVMPGYISDFMGLMLLIPPIRGWAADRFIRSFEKRAQAGSFHIYTSGVGNFDPSGHPTMDPRDVTPPAAEQIIDVSAQRLEARSEAKDPGKSN
ncbi:MAG TPA: FxsA family protein [Pseudobdellovibrionaceae bacterium]|nr:FxsA family protein [Pseudobdellovibrionaceae bacterium]